MVPSARRRIAARVRCSALPRSIVGACLVGTTLGLLPTRSSSSDAWLELAADPLAALVHRSDAGADAVIHLSLRNLTDRGVRVGEVRAVYLAGDRVLASQGDRERPFLEGTLAEPPLRIGPAERLPWRGICLEGVPAGSSRVRIEVVLTRRRGLLGRESRTQSVEVRLEEAPPPVLLRLPFEGPWRVTQGHTCRTNHRLGGKGGDFSWDFVALGERGPGAPSGPDRLWGNRDLPTFGRKVLAPAGGRVVRVVSDVPDNEGQKNYPRRTFLDDLTQPDWIFGNYVVLDVGSGAYVLLAHLEQGSMSVEPGRSVGAGETLARAGNSGNSVRPHVHLQVMDRADPTDPNVRGLPARFGEYREFRVVAGREHTDLFARSIAEGDPPEGAIVTPLDAVTAPSN